MPAMIKARTRAVAAILTTIQTKRAAGRLGATALSYRFGSNWATARSVRKPRCLALAGTYVAEARRVVARPASR